MESGHRLAVGADYAKARRRRCGVTSLIGSPGGHSLKLLRRKAVSGPISGQLAKVGIERAVLLNQNDEVIDLSGLVVWIGAERAARQVCPGRSGRRVSDALATMQHQDEDASYHKDKEHVVEPR